jgi:nitric oxide reductase large subunit
MLRGIIAIVYIVAGIAVANSHHYFTGLNDLMAILSAVLAVVLWPLILLGVDLHLGLVLALLP